MKSNRQTKSQIFHFSLARTKRFTNELYTRHRFIVCKVFVYLKRIVVLFDVLEYRYLVRIPERDLFSHVDAERLVTFLKATLGEVPQRIDVLSEIEPNLLSLAERERGHIGMAVADADLLESALAAERVHEELAVERETHRLVLQVDHDADDVAEFALLAECLAALMPLARRLTLERVRVCTAGDVRVGP